MLLWRSDVVTLLSSCEKLSIKRAQPSPLTQLTKSPPHCDSLDHSDPLQNFAQQRRETHTREAWISFQALITQYSYQS
jgi:hypothetical protein